MASLGAMTGKGLTTVVGVAAIKDALVNTTVVGAFVKATCKAKKDVEKGETQPR